MGPTSSIAHHLVIERNTYCGTMGPEGRGQPWLKGKEIEEEVIKDVGKDEEGEGKDGAQGDDDEEGEDSQGYKHLHDA